LGFAVVNVTHQEIYMRKVIFTLHMTSVAKTLLKILVFKGSLTVERLKALKRNNYITVFDFNTYFKNINH
jgi:hypothetical protein